MLIRNRISLIRFLIRTFLFVQFTGDMRMYGLYIGVSVLSALLGAMLLVQMLVTATKNCHNNMLNGLMRARVAYFLMKSAGE